MHEQQKPIHFIQMVERVVIVLITLFYYWEKSKRDILLAKEVVNVSLMRWIELTNSYRTMLSRKFISSNNNIHGVVLHALLRKGEAGGVEMIEQLGRMLPFLCSCKPLLSLYVEFDVILK